MKSGPRETVYEPSLTWIEAQIILRALVLVAETIPQNTPDGISKLMAVQELTAKLLASSRTVKAKTCQAESEAPRIRQWLASFKS